MQAVARAGDWCRRMILRGTDRWWKLFLILLIGWLWVPTTLLSAFGADVRSQAREFSWAWNQWLGVDQPYIGFFSFVPMDIYPTAHYLWPEDPTYLTDQHNIVLTVCYGAATAVSRYLTGSNDAGFVALSAIQFVFAAFCCAATANRFFNLPFLRPADGGERIDALRETGLARPAGALQRFVILLFFLVCPLAVFATISLTKSPLFAFSFVWWFGVWYELHMTRGELMPDGKARRLNTRSWMAFAAASCVMLISAKYAWYIIVLQILLALIADRRRWRVYVTALLLPTVLIHGGVVLMIQSGLIINGDPIESRGIQLQQIARVAKLNPEGIPDSAAELLEPIFNLDQMADAYRQDDADPVKSSGIQSKKVSYKWRTVTEEDMAQFNTAWAQIVAANPVIALDALLAKCYGYFDVTASPYTSMDYYVDSIYVQNQTEWIKDWCHDWRASVAQFARDWGAVPVLGWLTHGNLYVSLTLLIGAAEVVLRRWRTLAWHIPLALLMGVMITAPANNFERHMLPVAFCFGFLCLTFWRESLASRHTADGMPPNFAESGYSGSMTPSVWPLSQHRRSSERRQGASDDMLALLRGGEGDTLDARVESVAFECLADGLADDRVMSLLRVLGWRDDFTCFTVAGTPAKGIGDSSRLIREAIRNLGGSNCIIGARGTWCVALVEMQSAVTPEVACTAMTDAFHAQLPLCLGPVRHRVEGAQRSVRSVLAALAAAAAVPALPRPMRADDVLPERALLGDEDARNELVNEVYRSLRGDNADDPTLATVSTFLKSGNSLETTAKELNVHPNTVRYRLKRAAETTGWDATDPREGYVLQTAIALGLMKDAAQELSDGRTAPGRSGYDKPPRSAEADAGVHRFLSGNVR